LIEKASAARAVVALAGKCAGRFIIVRVNDRGPFIPGRIIDLSAGSARRLGFHKKGTARVLVETVEH